MFTLNLQLCFLVCWLFFFFFSSLFEPLTGKDKHPYGKVWITYKVWGSNQIVHNGCRGAKLVIDADSKRVYSISDYPVDLKYTYSPTTDYKGSCWQWDPWNTIVSSLYEAAQFGNKCNALYTTCTSEGTRFCMDDFTVCATKMNYKPEHTYEHEEKKDYVCQDVFQWSIEAKDRPLYNFYQQKSCDNISTEATNYINFLVQNGCCGDNGGKSVCTLSKSSKKSAGTKKSVGTKTSLPRSLSMHAIVFTIFYAYAMMMQY